MHRFGFCILLIAVALSQAAFAPDLAGEEGKGPVWKIQDATPGVRLEMKEVNRYKLSGKTYVVYGLESSSFPAGKSYGLWLWNFGEPEGWLMMKDFTADPAGRLMCEHPISEEEASGGKNRACVLDMDNLALRPAGTSIKGVPFRAAVVSTDGNVRAFVRSVPLPLEYKQGGCTISAEIASEKADAFLVQGEGFTPGETVRWSAEMGGGVTDDKATVSDGGKFVVALNPGATGKESGKVVFTARGKTCAPALIFKWGPPALK